MDEQLTEKELADRERAFLEAERDRTWKGRKLQPWTVVRHALFFGLRAEAGGVSSRAMMESPASFAEDAMRILWLCSLPLGELRRVGGYARKVELCDEWAEANVRAEDIPDAIALAQSIYDEGDKTRVEIDALEADGDGEPGEPVVRPV